MGLITTADPSEIKDLSRVHERLSRTFYLVDVLVHNNNTQNLCGYAYLAQMRTLRKDH